MAAPELFEVDVWALMEAVAREIVVRQEAHEKTDRAAKAAIAANGEAYAHLGEALMVWRDLVKVPTANAGHDGKFDPQMAIENARALVESQGDTQ